MRKALGVTGRVLSTLFILGWWTLGVVLLFGHASPAVLVFVATPLEIVGAIMAWKASDPDRFF